MHPILLLLVLLTACQTTKPSKLQSAAQSGETILTGSEARTLYQAMLRLEIRNGITARKRLVHSSRGKVQCNQDGALDACSVRLDLQTAPFISEGTTLSRTLARRMLDFFKAVKQEAMKGRRIALADITCDFVSQTLPGHQRSDYRCIVENPRRVSELVLDDQLSNTLQAHLTSSAKGYIHCQMATDELPASCKSSQTRDVLIVEEPAAGAVIPFPTQLASDLEKEILRVLETEWTIISKRRFRAPSRIIAPVSCRQISTTSTNPTVLCRLNLKGSHARSTAKSS